MNDNERKYGMNLMQIKNDEPELLDAMINFHKSPSARVFNQVISKLTGDLYKEEQSDKTDEFFITLEGETWEDKKRRLKGITNPTEKQKEKQKYDNCKIIFTNPRVLSWIYAACREFPWLILESSSSLIVERAIKYTEEGFYSTTNKIINGPLFKVERLSDGEQYVHIQKWKRIIECYLEQSILKYTASGNKYYLDYICEVESMIEEKYKLTYTKFIDNIAKSYLSIDDYCYLDTFRNALMDKKDKGKEKAE
ncbi:Hypothetical protein PACV_110 [Pacmanvirus A23]|uniref:Hypothetical protein n=1 Tax=Pacmanvirus A23 TaxID=1932881 RepID=UPI000A092525|nr:Hypothetical protein B9W72_gp109 [Pacmanvirus A23]SIP85826.1 Hypothetical protein PACV_110 [Pacmanvirus A23]